MGGVWLERASDGNGAADTGLPASDGCEPVSGAL